MSDAGPRPAQHVVFVGMMGAGKSTVGRLVAQRLGWSFVDVDGLIRERTGTTARQLWERGGEYAYRGLERAAVLETLADTTPSVLAAPGGVVLDSAARVALEQPGVAVVWLRATIETLASRVRSGDHRPLLGENPSITLGHLATARNPAYAELADIVVDVDSLGPAAVTERVLAALKGYASS